MFSFDLAAAPPRMGFFGLIGCAGLMVLHWLESLTQQASALLVLRRTYHPIVVGIMIGLCALFLLFPKYEINPFIYFRF